MVSSLVSIEIASPALVVWRYRLVGKGVGQRAMARGASAVPETALISRLNIHFYMMPQDERRGIFMSLGALVSPCFPLGDLAHSAINLPNSARNPL